MGELDDLAQGDVAQWRKQANEVREEGAKEWLHRGASGQRIKSPSDSTRIAAQRYRDGFDDRMAGREKPSQTGPAARSGFDAADDFVRADPRPEGPDMADFTLRTARGKETDFEIKNDADAIKTVRDNLANKHATTFYSNPFANPALSERADQSLCQVSSRAYTAIGWRRATWASL